MVKITFEGERYTCTDSESVLDCLTRHGHDIPSSCHSGVCQTCMMRAVNGNPPAEAQTDLKATLAAQNYFLACSCKPKSDLEVVLAGSEVVQRVTARIVDKQTLNQEIVKISLRCQQPFTYQPGQFLNVFRRDGLSRSYSIASIPQENETIDLHVRKLEGGQMSTWLHDELAIDDELDVSGATGDCFYVPGDPSQNLLLVGTGSGLAPLWGILRDALARGHHGTIHLFHGSHSVVGLYLIDELRTLTQHHENFHYTPCVSSDDVPEGFTPGRADQVALKQYPKLDGWRIYLCGHPEMVAVLKRRAFLSGASLQDIYADPFVISSQK